MAQPAERMLHLDEYLELEARSETRHEFYEGQMLAMAGGTVEHAHLSTRAALLLATSLGEGACMVFNSDLRIRILATGLITYPDLSIVCGPPQREAGDLLSVTNPVALVEVLSPNTEAYDRGEKFSHYRQIPSLRDYLLISTGRDRVEHFSRNEDGSWTVRHLGHGDTATLSGVAARLQVDELYARVSLVRDAEAVSSGQ